MNTLERIATIGGLVLGIFSIWISSNSNKLAREANDLVKEQQSAHTILIGFEPIKVMTATPEENNTDVSRASCLYTVKFLNTGGQSDFIESITTQIVLNSDDNKHVVTNSGKPTIISNQSRTSENDLVEGINSISVSILNQKIDNLNNYDWPTNPNGVEFPIPIEPNEAKEFYLLYTVDYSSRQKAFSWIDSIYEEESQLMDNEATFPITLILSTKPQFSDKTSFYGSYCLSFFNH